MIVVADKLLIFKNVLLAIWIDVASRTQWSSSWSTKRACRRSVISEIC